MCYACSEAVSQDDLRITLEDLHRVFREDRAPRRRTQTTVLIARSRADAHRFCRDYELNERDPQLIVIVPGDLYAEHRLTGLRDFSVVRADGARADDRVERYLRYLLAQVRTQVRTQIRTQIQTQVNAVDFMGSASAALASLRSVSEAGAHLPRRGGEEAVESAVEAAGYRERVRREVGTPEPEPQSATAWVSPHHWPSTLQRSPYWDVAQKILKAPTMDMTVLEYRPDELEEGIRYV